MAQLITQAIKVCVIQIYYDKDCDLSIIKSKMFITEGAANYPSMTAYRRNNAEHGIEIVGEKLRGMMPWITAEKIIDKSKN